MKEGDFVCAEVVMFLLLTISLFCAELFSHTDCVNDKSSTIVALRGELVRLFSCFSVCDGP